MISQNLIDFYNNWSRKAAENQGNDLASIYDKYTTLFVIYNNLYNQSREVLVASGVIAPKQNFDNQNATIYVVRYLGALDILNNFTASNIDTDIDIIIDVIDKERFHIKLKKGKADRNEDLKILNNLRSANSEDKAVAILQVLYNVRCNLFHGSKDFQEYQRLLVEPLINILGTLNRQLFAELNK